MQIGSTIEITGHGFLATALRSAGLVSPKSVIIVASGGSPSSFRAYPQNVVNDIAHINGIASKAVASGHHVIYLMTDRPTQGGGVYALTKALNAALLTQVVPVQQLTILHIPRIYDGITRHPDHGPGSGRSWPVAEFCEIVQRVLTAL